MIKEFYINSTLLPEYAAKRRKKVLYFLFVFFGITIPLNIFFFYQKTIPKTGLIICVILSVIMFVSLIRIDFEKSLRSIKFIMKEEMLYQYRDDKLEKEIAFNQIEKLKKDKWGIEIYKTAGTGFLKKDDPNKVYIHIPIVLEHYAEFEKELLRKYIGINKKGF